MDYSNILLLLCGLGLFLYGMSLMGDGLELAAGSSMKALIGKLTNNRFSALLLGCGVTALIQSSSATTVMVVGFVNARLMTLTQAVGVIMGANIGTTITGQIIAFNTTILSYIFIILGSFLAAFSSKKKYKYIGYIFTGLGLLFIGLQFMSKSMEPLREVEWFTNLLVSFKNPLIGIFAGMLFTAVIQSSSASVGILQAFAMQGLIGIEGSVYVILGINIGTCVTTILSCLKTNRNAKRAAVIHLLFNVIGMAILIPIIYFIPIIPTITALSPGNVVRQIANTHTIFNIIASFALFPFANWLVKLSKIIVKGEDEETTEMKLEYVDDLIFEAPSVAIEALQKEIHRMSDLAYSNLTAAVDCFCEKKQFTQNDQQKFEDKEKLLNYMNAELTRYLAKASSLELNDRDILKVAAFMRVIGDIERIGDHAENILEYSQIRDDNKLKFSSNAFDEINTMMDKVKVIIEESMQMFLKDEQDDELKSKIYAEEQEVDDLTDEYRNRHIKRLSNGECSPQSSMIFADLLTDLERVADHAINIGFVYFEVDTAKQ
ncbi:MAG: Na/Pi cotransporter family protein [Oscillospiraceae bacterium]